MTAATGLAFAQKLGKLLGVPVVACEPKPGEEFIYPTGDRDSLSADDNQNQLGRWQPGWAIMARTGGPVAVVDVDPRNGGDIEKTKQLLNGLNVRVFAEVATPSGGRHFYIAGHPELPSCSRLNGWPGIDVLSYGKLVFLVGTQRPKYGSAGYQVILENLEALADGGDPDGAEIFADWVAERRGEREHFQTSSPWTGGEPDARQVAYLNKMLAGMHHDLSVMGRDSGRNIAVYNTALKCGNFIEGAGLNEAVAIAMLLDASRRNGLTHDDGERSVLASIQSGIKNGKARPRAVPEARDPWEGIWEPPTGGSTNGSAPNSPPPQGEGSRSRWISLGEFLDGTYVPPCPNVGAEREDGIQFLYPGMWHTDIALTTAGKTTFALWEVKSVLESGGHVVYIHFEEASPNGIIHRLKALGVSTDAIRKRFHWGHVNDPWQWGELAAEIQRLEVPPQLAILDGINAACGMHGWDVSVNSSVGLYRAMFVHPLTKVGAAVLSLGHPPKAMNRQSESYSYGAAGWLNDVDGVGYRMTASKTPIGKGVKGSSALYVVKDRYGEVQRWGELQSGDGMPWWYMGQFIVDDAPLADITGAAQTVIRMTIPARNEEGVGRDRIDGLCDQIIAYLRETTGRFETVNKLKDALRAKGIHVTDSDVAPALLRLAGRGLIVWPDVEERQPRPGWLTDAAINPEEE
jgi:hypothetical protein